MKLQMALDDISLEDGLALVDRVADCVDIVEVGTPMVIACGMEPVRRIKRAHPHLEVLADLKIMDAGAYEANLAFQAGADYVTALGVAEDQTIRSCVEAAQRCGGRVVVDMLCVEDLPARVAAVEALGADYVAVHTGVDQQAAGRTPLEDLRVMAACAKTAGISVAGGISAETLPEYAAYRPDIVIVGSGIVHAEDPVAAARRLSELLRRLG